MKNYSNDNGEHNYDEGDEEFAFGDEFMKYQNLIEQENEIYKEHLEIEEKALREKLLFRAIKICEKSFFWKFFSNETRLNLVERTFKKFKRLVEDK